MAFQSAIPSLCLQVRRKGSGENTDTSHQKKNGQHTQDTMLTITRKADQNHRELPFPIGWPSSKRQKYVPGTTRKGKSPHMAPLRMRDCAATGNHWAGS